jgi:hypothetical protein
MLVSGLSTNTSSADTSEASASGSGLSLISSVSDFNTVVTTPGQTFLAGARTLLGWGQFGNGLDLSDIQAAKAAGGAVPVVPDLAAARGPALGNVGRAGLVGKQSVPQAWVAAGPSAPAGVGLHQLPDNTFRVASASAPDPSTGLGGMPAARTAGRGTGVPVLRNGRRIFRMPRPAYGG